jgi:hypothetical protein
MERRRPAVVSNLLFRIQATEAKGSVVAPVTVELDAVVQLRNAGNGLAALRRKCGLTGHVTYNSLRSTKRNQM